MKTPVKITAYQVEGVLFASERDARRYADIIGCREAYEARPLLDNGYSAVCWANVADWLRKNPELVKNLARVVSMDVKHLPNFDGWAARINTPEPSSPEDEET